MNHLDSGFVETFRGQRAVFRMQSAPDDGPVVWSVAFCGVTRRFTFDEWADIGLAWIVSVLDKSPQGRVRISELRSAMRILNKVVASR